MATASAARSPHPKHTAAFVGVTSIVSDEEDAWACMAASPRHSLSIKEAPVTPAAAPHDAYLVERPLELTVSLALAMLLASLDSTAVVPAVPSIAREFDAFSRMSWIGSAFVMASSTSQALYGKLGDIFGGQRTLLAALFLFLLGSIGCGAAPNMEALIGFRVLQGIGGGAFMPLGYILVAEIVPLSSRDRYISALALPWALSAAVGPVVSGAIVDAVSWRLVFYLHAPLTLITMMTVAYAIPHVSMLYNHAGFKGDGCMPARRASLLANLRQFDWAGSIAMVGFAVSLLLAVSWGGVEQPWSSPLILSLFATSALFIAAFIYIEARMAKTPIAPPSIFRSRTVLAIFIGNFFMGAAFFGLAYYMPIYYQVARGETATQAGIYMLPMLFPAYVIDMLTGQLTSRVPAWSHTLLASGGAALMALALGLLATVSEQRNLALELSTTFLASLGFGALAQSIVTAVQSAVAPRHVATATSLSLFARFMGITMGVAVLGVVLNTMLLASLPSSITAPSPGQGQAIRLANPGSLDSPEQRHAAQSAYLDAFRVIFGILCGAATLATLSYALIRVRVSAYERAKTAVVSDSIEVHEGIEVCA